MKLRGEETKIAQAEHPFKRFIRRKDKLEEELTKGEESRIFLNYLNI